MALNSDDVLALARHACESLRGTESEEQEQQEHDLHAALQSAQDALERSEQAVEAQRPSMRFHLLKACNLTWLFLCWLYASARGGDKDELVRGLDPPGKYLDKLAASQYAATNLSTMYREFHQKVLGQGLPPPCNRPWVQTLGSVTRKVMVEVGARYYAPCRASNVPCFAMAS
jgi:hypothetical protein